MPHEESIEVGLFINHHTERGRQESPPEFPLDCYRRVVPVTCVEF